MMLSKTSRAHQMSHLLARLAAVAALVLGLLLNALPSVGGASGDTRPTAQVIQIQGAIGPATADYVAEAMDTARQRAAALIVVTMDTPGGLADSMREIIHSILDAPVAVAVFVYPSGSRAASAGTYILYAAHIAAMAPGTNLGAATPIQIGGGLPLPGGRESPPDEDEKAAPKDVAAPDALTAKIVNDSAAYIRSLAQMRGRNAEWAEQSVREGVSLAVDEALEKNVIDLVAPDIDTLLREIDGRKVVVANQTVTLETAGLTVETIAPGWRNRLLATLTNPNIAFILILLGIYGLFFEFANPGSIGPGVAGAICLLLGFYALNLLPLNYAGLGLLILSIALMAAEALTPSFGVLGVGGLVAFVLSATMLFDSEVPGFSVSWPVIIVTAASSGLLMILLLGYVWRAQRRPVTTGSTAWLGKEAEVLEWSGTSGIVRCGGERWKAVAEEPLAPRERVEVCGMSGLTLSVEKKPPQP